MNALDRYCILVNREKRLREMLQRFVERQARNRLDPDHPDFDPLDPRNMKGQNT